MMNVFLEVGEFYRSYGGKKLVYGESFLGRPLYAFHIGSESGAQIVSQYAIHAREWITALLALRHIRRGLRTGGAWILPLTNPDGALLSETGPVSVTEQVRGELVAINGGEDFSLWKANAQGVDLNVNFNAQWGKGASNLFRPAPAGYVGPAPFSAPETAALAEFTLRVRPAATVSWHTKGEEIYYEFHQPLLRRRRDKKLAAVLSSSTGYPLVRVKNSAGGYKDWCVEKLRIPAFTVETGSDRFVHPLARSALPEIVNAALEALWDLSEAL